MKEAITEFRGEYYFLSNFYMATVVYEGISYSNTEAAFQAQKCENYEDRKLFSGLSPSDAKKKGRHIRLRKDWEEVKYKCMYAIVSEKFKQNAELAKKLLATGDAHLEEGNSWGDRIWGTVNGVGKNALGKILMQVREDIQKGEG